MKKKPTNGEMLQITVVYGIGIGIATGMPLWFSTPIAASK